MVIRKGNIAATFNEVLGSNDYNIFRRISYIKDSNGNFVDPQKILNEGFSIDNLPATFNISASFLGKSNIDREKMEERLFEFCNAITIILAIPSHLQNGISLDFLEISKGEYYNEAVNEVCARYGIPREFVFGYFADKKDSIDFEVNNAHYSQLSDEEKRAFSEKFLEYIKALKVLNIVFSEEMQRT